MDQRTLGARVEAVIGRPTLSKEAGPGLAVAGDVGPEPGGWVAVLEARRGGEPVLRRTLRVTSTDCHHLDEAVVLVVALMLDSSETEPASLQVPAEPAPTSLSIGADVGFALGVLPGVAVGFGLASTIRFGAFWPVALWSDFWPVSHSLKAGAGGGLSAWTAGAGLCPVHVAAGPTLEFLACLGATGGAIDSNGVGVDVPRSETKGYADAELRLGVGVHLAGPVFARVDVGGGIPFTRYAYRYTAPDGGTDQVFRTAPAIGIGHACLELRVP